MSKSIKLREYQKNAIDKGFEYFQIGDSKKRPIIVAPTGAGKSIYAANLTSKLKKNVLVLQPSKELLEQNYAKFRAYGGVASIYSASVGKKEVGDVTFATIGSVVKKPELFSHKEFVIIDECHLVPPNSYSMYMKFFKNLGQKVKYLGLTATPFRLKRYNDPFTGKPFSKINLLTRESPRFFNIFLFVTQIKELYDLGFLSPVKYIPLEWNDGQLVVNTTGAEFSDESVDWALKNQKVHERIPDIIKQGLAKGRKHFLIFVKNVNDGLDLAKRVPNSACVHATTKKKEREEILNDFRSGKIKAVFNVGVLTIGFDFPELDAIIIARPTMSLALYMQMIGRGIRTADNKTDCALVEMCGNFERFGKIEDITYLETIDGWVIHNGIRQLSGVRLDEIANNYD